MAPDQKTEPPRRKETPEGEEKHEFNGILACMLNTPPDQQKPKQMRDRKRVQKGQGKPIGTWPA